MMWAMSLNRDFKALVDDLRHFPWRSTLGTLRERFSQDRLGVTAGSLTFTTLIALVPFFALILAVFTAFPVFGKFQTALQQWLLESLVPDNIARQVLGYLTQFAAKASRLGWFGLMLLVVTAISLVLTIDRAMNNIWRVRQLRPWGQRVLIYWSALTLGPVMLGASLSATSYVISANKGLVAALPGGVGFLIDVLQWLMMVVGMGAMYRYVPNTVVHWRHALIGGIFVSAAFEFAKKLLGLYLGSVPSYSAIYGTFATLPILLIWIYIGWLIVLFGAVIVAYLPSLLVGVPRRGGSQGWNFQLALEVLTALEQPTQPSRVGLTQGQLALQLRVDDLHLQRPLQVLQDLDWIGRLEPDEDDHQRYVLLQDVAKMPARALVEKLLWVPVKGGVALERGRLFAEDLVIKDLLPCA